MITLYYGWLTTELVDANIDKIFVFGDNCKRYGTGGQAVIRSCDNSLGLVTKRKPTMQDDAFFEDGNKQDKYMMQRDFRKIRSYLEIGDHVVIPINHRMEINLGTERAKLKEKAPELHYYMLQEFCKIITDYSPVFVTHQL